MTINELDNNSALELVVTFDNKKYSIAAIKINNLKDNIIQITVNLPDAETKSINFDNVHVDLFYYPEHDIPIKWNSVTIKSVHGKYILFTPKQGIHMNRRDTFRIGLSVQGNLIVDGKKNNITIRDLSLSGCSFIIRDSDLKISANIKATLSFYDLGYDFNIPIKIIRKENLAIGDLYGCTIIKSNNKLSEYIATKQRRKKENNKRNKSL